MYECGTIWWGRRTYEDHLLATSGDGAILGEGIWHGEKEDGGQVSRHIGMKRGVNKERRQRGMGGREGLKRQAKDGAVYEGGEGDRQLPVSVGQDAIPRVRKIYRVCGGEALEEEGLYWYPRTRTHVPPCQ